MARFSTRRCRGWLKKPVTSVAAFFLVAPTLVTAATVVGSTVAPQVAQADSTTQAAVALPNKTVFIYDNFPSDVGEAVGAVDSAFRSFKGYDPILISAKPTKNFIRSQTSGPLSHGDATLTSFINMAGAGAIVFFTHGIEAPNSTEPPGLLVEWDGTKDEANTAWKNYVLKDEINPNYIAPVAADTFYEGLAGIGSCTRTVTSCEWGIELTNQGIAHYFGPASGKKSGLVGAFACFGANDASDFNTTAYFGYPGQAEVTSAVSDAKTLFRRLQGDNGVGFRNTTEANNLGGFNQGFGLVTSGNQYGPPAPVTLAPAVTSVTPPPTKGGSTGGSGNGGLITATRDESAPELATRVPQQGFQRRSLSIPKWTRLIRTRSR